MTDFGIVIEKVALSGNGVADAAVELNDGLNVISGPSDTGKTFIAQCIDYICGARSRPRDIPEATGYERVEAWIRARETGATYRLERSLHGGPVVLHHENNEDQTLAERHSPDREDTISHFLLELSGLAPKIIRTNARGTTRTLSFRDIARLVIVGEEEIIREASPIHSGRTVARTAESNVFRLLLTGVDDSSVVEAPDPQITRGRRDAQLELLADLLEQVTRQLEKVVSENELPQVPDRLNRSEEAVAAATAQLEEEEAAVIPLEESRREALAESRRCQSRVDVLSELTGRFALLDRQYRADLGRLEAMSQASLRLEQMQEVRCPVCGAAAEHQERGHEGVEVSPSDVATACAAEAARINVLIDDLQNTIRATEAELLDLIARRDEARRQIDNIESTIAATVEPRRQAALQQLFAAQGEHNRLKGIAELIGRKSDLEQRMLALQAQPAQAESQNFQTNVTSGETEELCQAVESLLRQWQFPELGRVLFSEDDQDLVISGRPRSSHGKGVRAITRASFNLGLMSYCRDRERAHPGFVVLDSPLVVYREPDENEEGFSPNVKDAFYHDLADRESGQVVVLENDDPPADIYDIANVIRFTGSDQGRRGFIPERPGEAD